MEAKMMQPGDEGERERIGLLARDERASRARSYDSTLRKEEFRARAAWVRAKLKEGTREKPVARRHLIALCMSEFGICITTARASVDAVVFEGQQWGEIGVRYGLARAIFYFWQGEP